MFHPKHEEKTKSTNLPLEYFLLFNACRNFTDFCSANATLGKIPSFCSSQSRDSRHFHANACRALISGTCALLSNKIDVNKLQRFCMGFYSSVNGSKTKLMILQIGDLDTCVNGPSNVSFSIRITPRCSMTNNMTVFMICC